MSKLAKSTVPLFGVASVAIAIDLVRSSNMRVVRKTFAQWSAGHGSIFDLMIDESVIVIPGTAPHCGTFTKSDFMRDVANPFMARFSNPPIPTPTKIFSDGEDVAVVADAKGTTRDGRSYENSYVFVLKMKGGRILQATEFLDMVAFNDVWDRVEPATSAVRNSEERR